jgi:hypothetical protein
MQAIAATIAIVAVYYTATIPMKAEARYRANERKLRADGTALLLLPSILVLKGVIETAIDSGSILGRPVVIPDSLLSRADDLYLLGDAGARLLSAMGIVDAVLRKRLVSSPRRSQRRECKFAARFRRERNLENKQDKILAARMTRMVRMPFSRTLKHLSAHNVAEGHQLIHRQIRH